jgi:hypothetical protein
MTGIRDVEELERVRAETDRKSNLDDEEGKGDFYANAAGESERSWRKRTQLAKANAIWHC